MSASPWMTPGGSRRATRVPFYLIATQVKITQQIGGGDPQFSPRPMLQLGGFLGRQCRGLSVRVQSSLADTRGEERL
ncbi:hypothetical protein Nm8I071_37690 [Nonomuraea sp. TT08I-71]|nr:hypothetical protein Nm8I071_37690 [Nonomuraea sp. TT08I-71]